VADLGGERIVADPRRAYRERKQALAEGYPAVGTRLGDRPPGLFDDSPGIRRRPLRAIRELAPEPEGPDPYRDALRLQVRPGKRRNGRARVRVYHLLPGYAPTDRDGLCWAFTISRAAWERLQTERVLDSEGAVYPDGRPCVPPDLEPLDVPIQCGSCGTTSVECLQIQFYEE